MHISFFHFPGMDHVIQPQFSNWCWAACLEKLINGLSSQSTIGTDKCSLVSFYNRNFVSINEQNQYDYSARPHPHSLMGRIVNACCGEVDNATPSINCNAPISDIHLGLILDYCGFKSQLVDVNELSDFQFVKETLIKTDAPIILRVITPTGGSHIVLINGYGETNSCNYIINGDPLNSDDRYTHFQSFLTKTTILNAWKIEPLIVRGNTTKQLTIDLVIEKNFDVALAALRQLDIDDVNQIYQREDFKVLGEKVPIRFEEAEFYVTNLLQVQASQIPMAGQLNKYARDSCKEHLNRYDISNFGDIRALVDPNKLFGWQNMGSQQSYSYLAEYATRIKIKNVDGTLFARPIFFPQNYDLEDKWQPYEHFMAVLKKLPEVNYIIN